MLPVIEYVLVKKIQSLQYLANNALLLVSYFYSFLPVNHKSLIFHTFILVYLILSCNFDNQQVLSLLKFTGMY
jgi:hypothetical protein